MTLFERFQAYVPQVEDDKVNNVTELLKQYSDEETILARIQDVNSGKELVSDELTRITNAINANIVLECSSVSAAVPDTIKVQLEVISKELCALIPEHIINVGQPPRRRKPSERKAPAQTISSYQIGDDNKVMVAFHTQMIGAVTAYAITYARNNNGDENILANIKGSFKPYFSRDRNALDSPSRCGDTGWFTESKTPAPILRKRAQRVLDALGVCAKITFED